MKTTLPSLAKWVSLLSGYALFLGGIFLPSTAQAQINIAPSATVTASACNTGPCSTLNDLDFGTCGSQQMWIPTSTPPSLAPGTDWIEWQWPNAESFDEIVIHHAQDNARFLTGATIQYWDGSSWQNHHTFSNLTMQCINSVVIPRLTTNRFRITSFQMTGTGQLSNPNFREIEIFSAPTAPNDAGVSSLVSPVAFCPGQENITVRVQNFGINQITSVTVNWTLNGVAQTPVNVTTLIDTIGGVNPFFTNVTLGSQMFLANTTYNIVAWTSMPNNVVDTINFNDTLTASVSPAISGTFTINSGLATSGTNFQSFTDFANFMNINGICGPVVANVAPSSGPYNERVQFEEITGASSVNTITINGNGNTLSFAGDATNRTTLTLNGTDYLTIDNLNIVAAGVTYAWVLFMNQGADHNTFKNCSLSTSTSSASTFVCNVVMSGSPTGATTAGNAGSYNTFENNVHIGGYYGFAMNGPSAASKNVGNKILNSVFEDFYFYGMYIRSQDSITINGNDLSRSGRTSLSTFYGLYFATGIEGARILNNRIHDNSNQNTASTAAAYPIYMTGATGTAGNPNLMANNLVYNINSNGLLYGMYLLGTANNFWNIYHNTIVIDNPTASTTTNTRLLWLSGNQANMNIKNNIFYLDRGAGGTQYMIYLTSALTSADINNNNYYTPNSNVIFGFNGANTNNFADWQSAGRDANGLFADPVFQGGTGPDPLQPTAPVIKFLGTNVLSDVPFDILGMPRTPAPDPGAYQFEPPQGIDMAITKFISPNASCPGTVNVEIEVGNFASDTATTFTVNWSINSVAQTPVVQSGLFLPGSLSSIVLGSFTLAPGVAYNIEATIVNVGPTNDIDLTNNQMSLIDYRSGLSGTYTINQLATPSASNFSSFVEARDALNDYGVCGPVVFNVLAGTGPYNEQVMFGSISGVSATNTVTINGNGNTLTYLSSNTNERHTLGLNGASYMTFDSLVIISEGTTTTEFGWGIWLTNSADHNTFQNCHIQVDTASTSLNYSGVVMSNTATSATLAGTAGSFNTFTNNTIEGGYYSLTVNGNNAADRGEGNQFINNKLTKFRFYGLYMRAQENMVFKGNEITRGNRSITGSVAFYGIYMITSNVGCEITGNKIYNTCQNCTNNTSVQYGLYGTGSAALANQPSVFANNIMSDFNGDGTAYGIYVLTQNYWKFYHNTISMDASTSSTITWGIYSSGANTGTEFVNNIISVDKGGNTLGYNFPTASHSGIVNYNGIYTPNGFIGRQGTTDYTSLADWQTGTGNDLNGESAPPLFINPANFDYTPGTPAFYQAGTNLLTQVPVDFFNTPRTITPDFGAIQFTPLPCAGSYGLTNDSVTPTSGFFSWGSYENNWVVQWGPVGFLPGSGFGTSVSATTNNGFEVTGFQSNTCYHVFVADVCGTDTSTWTGPVLICTPKAHDAALLGMVEPNDRDCGEPNTPLQVELRNNGFFPITSADITVEITGAMNQTFNFTYTGNLPMDASTVVTVATVDFSLGGLMDFMAFVHIPNDEDSSNDTIMENDVRIIPDEPRFEHLPLCAGDVNVTIFGVHLPMVTSYEWFNTATGGTPFSTNDTITIPVAMLPNVWLAYDTAGVPTPMVPSSCIPTSSCTSGDQIDNFSTTGGLSSNISNLSSGCSPNAYADNTNMVVDAVPGGTVNFTVQAGPSWGQGFRIWVDWNGDGIFGAGEDVWNSGTSGLLPYTGTITVPMSATPGEKRMRVRANFASLPLDPCAAQTFGEVEDYTFVVIGNEACSPARTQVNITADSVPTASFTYTILPNLEVQFISTSTPAGITANWDFAGLGTATGDTVTFTFPQVDTFQVCLTVSNFCASDDVCMGINVYGIGVETFAVSNLNVYPNPNQGRFTLSFVQDFVSDLSVELLDLSGKVVHIEVYKKFSGNYLRDFEQQNIASGSYMLRIRNEKGVVTKRIAINK